MRSPSPSRRVLLPGVLVSSAIAFGCSATVGAESDAGSTQRLALVEVQVHEGPVRFDASARFASIRSSSEPGAANEALDLLGLGWGTTPTGTCAALGGETLAPPLSAFRVDLRDLSPVALELTSDRGDATRLRLEPRAFPDVVGLVSGVVFVAPADVSGALSAPPRLVSMQAAGATIGGLELPDLPSRLQLLGADGEGGTYTVPRAFDVVASSLRGDDRLVIDLVRGGVARARCGVDRAGKLHVDVTSFGGPGEATLVIRAQRRVLRVDATLGAVEARLERDMELKLLVK